jgi:RNA polymerase sigma-70 factor, ECF subfamily
VAAFSEGELAGVRRGLLVFCYEMLGSPFDAEDAVQDAVERIWRSRDSFDPSRGAFSTWCYRIARNVCVDRLRDAVRRPLPRDLRAPGIDVEAPLVPAFDVPWLTPAPSRWFADSEVERAAEQRADVRIAVTAMLQTLSPVQRGAFVLRDVLGLSADEAATSLDVSVASANSALQRARAAIREGVPRRRALAPGAVEQYARAIERADVGALASLVADDVVFEMPPVPQWSVGRETFRAFMTRFFERRGTSWLATAVEANGQRGILLSLPGDEGPTPHTLQLFDGRGSGPIDHVLVYQDPRLFDLFRHGE